jgi:hypothetical protein
VGTRCAVTWTVSQWGALSLQTKTIIGKLLSLAINKITIIPENKTIIGICSFLYNIVQVGCLTLRVRLFIQKN